MQVSSTVKIDFNRIRQLTQAQITALELTAEELHTDVVQAQVIPFDDPEVIERRVYGKRGQFAKNGREYKGRIVRETVHGGGNLQNNSTFVDYTDVRSGRAVIVSSTPYARRLYFHPEYKFDKGENPHARGKWYTDWLPGGKKKNFCREVFEKHYRRITGV